MILLLVLPALARDAALLAAGDPGELDATREQVLQKGWFATMDGLDVGAATPTIDALLGYDAVLVYPHQPFHDPVALGDVLAAYLEAGGGVVLGHGAFSDDQGLGGAFAAAHQPLLPGPRIEGRLDWDPLIPDHPILVGTTWFDPGSSHRTATAGPTVGAEVVASWADGLPLVVTLEPANAGRVVALNLMPAPDTVDPSFWAVDCDIDDLLARSLLWTTGYEWPFATACWSGTILERDRNCNGTEAADEPPVDLSDPECAANVDPATGAPYPNADEYVDYPIQGCRYPVADFDPDEDGFGAGSVYVLGDDGLVAYTRVLECDHCPDEWNPLQEDVDCDSLGDVCDPCAETPGGFSHNDDDPWGDVCDLCPYQYDLDPDVDWADNDGDGWRDCNDNCPEIPNPLQEDPDFDAIGDVCDPCPTVFDDGLDEDQDGVGNGCDNCPFDRNPNQTNTDNDHRGDVCDPCPAFPRESLSDRDDDGWLDDCDPCPDDRSEDPLADLDADGVGDACDLCPADADPANGDEDSDSVGDACDRCPTVPGQFEDQDVDGFGDGCDRCRAVPDDQSDRDDDGVGDACDPCPDHVSKADEPDVDGDGWPDLCDGCPDEPGLVCASVALRGGGRGCATTSGSGWLGLLLLLGVRCSSRR